MPNNNQNPRIYAGSMHQQEFEKLFKRGCVITVANDLIDLTGFNFEQVPDKSYNIFSPVFTKEQSELFFRLDVCDVMFDHMTAVRHQALDVEGEEYLFIRAYRVGHTPDLSSILIIMDTQVRGGCYFMDADGRIGGDGRGTWYVVLCPSKAGESQLLADIKRQEVKRREQLPKVIYCGTSDKELNQVDTSEIRASATQAKFWE